MTYYSAIREDRQNVSQCADDYSTCSSCHQHLILSAGAISYSGVYTIVSRKLPVSEQILIIVRCRTLRSANHIIW